MNNTTKSISVVNLSIEESDLLKEVEYKRLENEKMQHEI